MIIKENKKAETVSQRVVTTTARGVMQAAENAMGGDIINAFVEIFTNTSDAYARNFTSSKKPKKNSSLTQIDRKNKIFRFYDKAGGMDQDLLRRALSVGGVTSNFDESKEIRGFFGRGLKDVMGLGRLEVETIHDKKYNKKVLDKGYLNEEEPELDENKNSHKEKFESIRSKMKLSDGENGTLLTFSFIQLLSQTKISLKVIM